MRHSYSTNGSERRILPFFFALAAIGLTYLFSHTLRHYQLELPWWAPAPFDTMAFYGLVYFLYDRALWRLAATHSLGITSIPDLSGEWRGKVTPTQTSGVSAGLMHLADIVITVTQSWTTLTIAGETTQSVSKSLSAAIIVEDDCTLSYEYVNEPLASAPETMHVHRGAARLTLSKLGDQLTGDYYSGRDRQNFGTITLRRMSDSDSLQRHASL